MMQNNQQDLHQRNAAFHIHVDGVNLPVRMENQLKSNFGFYNDDFGHSLKVNGSKESLPARQLTLKIMDPTAGKQVRELCLEMRDSRVLFRPSM